MSKHQMHVILVAIELERILPFGLVNDCLEFLLWVTSSYGLDPKFPPLMHTLL